MSWSNFRTVKSLKTDVIYWWTSLPIITLWVTKLGQICRLCVFYFDICSYQSDNMEGLKVHRTKFGGFVKIVCSINNFLVRQFLFLFELFFFWVVKLSEFKEVSKIWPLICNVFEFWDLRNFENKIENV